MAKSAQPSPVLKTWNKLSFVNKVYAVLFLFLLVAMAISIPFVAGEKQLGETRSRASGGECFTVKDGSQGQAGGQPGVQPFCPTDKGWVQTGDKCCKKQTAEEGQGGGGDPTGGAGAPPPGSGVCDAAGNCSPPPGAGGGGGSSSGGSAVKKQPTKPDRETMKAICPFIIDFIELTEGLPETSEDTKAMKQYLKSHNTEYRGWGRIDQFSGSEIYRFAKQYCPDFPKPTPTPTP